VKNKKNVVVSTEHFLDDVVLFLEQKSAFRFGGSESGLPDFSWDMIPKPVKNVPNVHKIYLVSVNISNGHKIYQHCAI
jgi:hypothetical protein